MTNPFFSIIIPIYNVEKYLNQCVDSVLNQSFEDYEVILVDDGSPDHCPQICDKYAEGHDNVRVIHKQNGGLSDARNAGIRAAKGEYVCFIDSDDYWRDENVLALISDRILKENHPDVVLFWQCSFFEGRKNNGEGSLEVETKIDPYAEGRTLGRGEFIGSACSHVIDRKILIDNDLFFKKGIKSEDIEWAIRLYEKEPRTVLIRQRLYMYREGREGSITSTIDYAHLCDYCNIIESSIENVKSCNQELKNELMSYIMYHVLIATAHTQRVKLTKEQKTEIETRLRKVCRKYLLKYRLNKKVKYAIPFYILGGYPLMAKMLGAYLKYR